MQKTLNINDLKKMLRISDPFLFIDSVDNIVPKKSGIGRKFLKQDEWFFTSHFTDEPVMPGTLQTECMLQTIISVAMSGSQSEKNNHLVVKSSVNFFSTITHSGSITVKANITGVGKGSFQADAELIFEDSFIANGKFRFVLPGSLEIT